MINRVLAVMLIVLLISCNNVDKQSQKLSERVKDSTAIGNKLDGNWELFKVDDTVFSIEKVYSINYGGQPKITIDTEGNKIGGFTGCNAWGTTLHIQNDTFVIDDSIEKHEQACGGTWEAEFLNFLRDNKSFTLVGDNLKLSSGGNTTMTFRKVK